MDSRIPPIDQQHLVDLRRRLQSMMEDIRRPNDRFL